MPVGENKYILIGGVHIKLRIVLHYLEIQSGKILNTAQRATGVATLATMYHSYNISSDLAGDFF